MWARWYCRAKHTLHRGLSFETVAQPLYWYPSAPSATLARQRVSSQLTRWFVWALVVAAAIQTYFYVRDLPAEASRHPVEAEWVTFPWFPTLLVREQLMSRVPADATSQWLAVSAGLLALLLAWRFVLPWALLAGMLAAIHEYQTRHDAAHAWDDFPWSVVSRILRPLNGWIHAGGMFVLAWFAWPISVPIGVATTLLRPTRATTDGLAWLWFLMTGFRDPSMRETTELADADVSTAASLASSWPLWSMLALWLWNMVEWAMAESSGVKPRMVGLHVLVAVLFIGGITFGAMRKLV